MAVSIGVTTSANVTKARKLFVAAATAVGEQKEVAAQLVDRKTLPQGMGISYNEPYWPAIQAMSLAEGVPIQSPQRMTDQSIVITTGEIGAQVAFTRKMAQTISESFPAVAGKALGNAIARKKDKDIIGYLSAFSVQLGTTSTTLTSGLIGAASVGIEVGRQGTARTGALPEGDPAPRPFFGLFHPYNRYDLASQLSGLGVSGAIGTTAATISQGGRPLARGLSEDIILNNFDRNVMGVDVYYDGNIPINTNSIVGVVASREGVVLVQFRGMDVDQEWQPRLRAWEWTATEEYGIGYRADAWGRAIVLDATPPAD